VPVSDSQSSAITDWLSRDSTNTFELNLISSVDQPEFPNP
jgi:hypothetical protein